jgi:hypothetical protein
MHINLTDISFATDRSADYDLSIQIDNEGLAYCIYNPVSLQYHVFVKYNFISGQSDNDNISKIADIFLKDSNLSLEYKSVRLLHYSQYNTLVPASFYDRKNAAEYLSYNQVAGNKTDVFDNFISNLKIWNIFSVPSSLVSVLKSRFSNIYFMNQATPFLNISVGQTSREGIAVHAGINIGFFDIAVFNGSRLEMYNTFQYNGEADLLYYVLYIFRQMDLDVKGTPFYISGEMSRKLSYLELLRENIQKLEYEPSDIGFSMAPGLSSISPKKYLNLLSMLACVSQEENTEAEK